MLTNNNKTGVKKRSFFTLIELIVTMAIFVVLLGIITRFYSTADKVTSASNEQTMTFENAKIALDLMTREIQCIYYENGEIPFWHWKPTSAPASWGNNRNEFLGFVSASSILPNDDCTSKLCEIKYQKYYATNHDDPNDGWLRRSATGNKLDGGADNPKWNYYNNLVVGYTTDLIAGTDTPVAAFTANSDSSSSYQKVIPYVTDLTFACFDEQGDEIDPDTSTSTASDAGTITGFPFSIEISLSLMDKTSWQKWIDLGGSVDPEDDTGAVRLFRKEHERTFRKTILIGNRGQYD